MQPFQPISRRHVLRGAGALLPLPFLDAMRPRVARAAGSTDAPLRLAFVFFPNGAVMPDWTPKEAGKRFELPRTLAPLADVREHVSVLSGLAQDNARAKGDGAGDHARSAASFLTGAHPTKTDGADIRAGVSVDQVAAEKLGAETKLPSLEIGLEGGRNAGQCDSGYACAYSNNISWKSPSTPMAKEIHPKLVFERLFDGGKDAIRERQKRDFYRKSILDSITQDADRLQQSVGQADRRKLDEYYTSLRDIELRIERGQRRQQEVPLPDIKLPETIPSNLDEHQSLMYELLTIAFQTDTTRIATFMLANEGSNRSYPTIGVNDGHHHLSHHQDKPDFIAQLQQIDTYLMQHFARFLKRLATIREGDARLIDQCLIVYGSAISDGNRHDHHDLPILLAGHGGGTVTTGRHITYPKDTPLNNLFLSLLERVGSKVDRLGDSTGPLDGLSL